MTTKTKIKKRDKKLSMEKIDDIIAERLAEILVMQLDYQKMLKMDKKSLRLICIRKEGQRNLFWLGRAAFSAYQKLI